MPYPTYTNAELAAFTGRPAATFPAFVLASAIPQALLLFKVGTCLASLDDLTDDEKQMVDFAILSMADAIHLAQPYQSALANPFSSESIGSYSYSKMASRLVGGLPTTIGWFDMAIGLLGRCGREDGIVTQGGIEIDFAGFQLVPGRTEGNLHFLSPAEIDSSRRYGYDPSAIGS